ncbi:MAG: hypothetical protein DRG83_18215 [Deltaproteobacteria bacterium]|nr:MAG: hypothetical protein DRG83_18215 [Deltaproteobacteria bacterium]
MVPLPLGLLKVERALLVTPNSETLFIKDTTVEVYEDVNCRRLLRGRGFVHNRSMVDLLEKSETFDIVLDFGDDIFFLLKKPLIQVGKVFDEKVRSTLHFSIGEAVSEISTKEACSYF